MGQVIVVLLILIIIYATLNGLKKILKGIARQGCCSSGYKCSCGKKNTKSQCDNDD